MIDWKVVWTSGLWILGTAVLLGTFSYSYWLSQTESVALAEIQKQPAFTRLFYIGFTLILWGLVFTSSRWWETAVWLLFVGWATLNLIVSLQNK